MPQLSLRRMVPQRLLNSVVAALLLLAAPTLAHGGAAPPSRAVLAIDESTTATQLATLLPFTVTFHDRMGIAVVADLPTSLSPDSTASMNEYRAGDVAYVIAEQSIVVFLSDGSAVPDHGLIFLGHLKRGLPSLVNCRSDCPIELTVDPTGL